MKSKSIFLLLMFFQSIFNVNRHIHNKHSEDIHDKKSVRSCNLTISTKHANCYSYKEYVIPKIFFDFIELALLSCKEYFFYIIDNYTFPEKKDELKNAFFSFSPEDIWNELNSEKNFDCDFINMINAIYNKDEFILIYKTRMTIEFMVFAFNIKEKTTKYQYTYFHNADLKKILHNLLDFINNTGNLLDHKISGKQIDDFKKFLHKYISHKSIDYANFLHELTSFKSFLDIFFKEKGNANISIPQKISIFNRFTTIFK